MAKFYGYVLLFIVVCGFFLGLTCYQRIAPGYVGVVVDLFGDQRGVEDKELTVGYHWIGPWKSVYAFPIFEQNYTWEGDDEFNFQTSEGLAVSAEVGITYNLVPESIPDIFAKYRRGMVEITDIFIRNNLRDAINRSASKMKIEDLYGKSKEEFFDDVESIVRADLAPIGIHISRIYLIGRFHFPQNVVAALNQKIEATQRAQQRENELREAQAQAQKEIAKEQGSAQCQIISAEGDAKARMVTAEYEAKAIAIKAKAQAEANMLLAESLTLNLIESQRIQRWDGKLPTYTNGQMMMFAPKD